MVSASDQELEELWRMHFEPMVRLARKQLAGRAVAGHDEEDIALSAMKSFCAGMREGRFEWDRGVADLWPLLARLTLNKAIDRLREQGRIKRGGAQTRVFFEEGTARQLATVDDPAVLAESRDCFERLIGKLDLNEDATLAPILVAKLEGHSNTQIARELSCSSRTIQRKLTLIKRLWEEE